jgi:hypothetical protein
MTLADLLLFMFWLGIAGVVVVKEGIGNTGWKFGAL